MSRKTDRDSWYIIQSEPVIRHGPISTAKLKDLYSNRVISNTTYVWGAGKDAWQPLHLCNIDSIPAPIQSAEELSSEPELLPNLRFELNQLREQNAVQLNEIASVTRERNFFKDQIHEERMTHKNELRKLTALMTDKVKQHSTQYENTCNTLRQENTKFRALLHAAVQMPGHGGDAMDTEFFHPTNFPPRLHPQLSTLSLQVALSPRQSYQMAYPAGGEISTQEDLLGMLEMDTDSQISAAGRDEPDEMSMAGSADRALADENKRLSAANEHLQKRLRELTSIKTRQEIQLAGLEARIKVLEEELHEGDSKDVEGIRELREQIKTKDSMLQEANHLINSFIRSSQSRLLEGARLTRAVILPPEFAERLESWLDYRGKFWGCTNLLVDLQQMSRKLRMDLRNVVNNQSVKLKQLQFTEETSHNVNSWTAGLSRAFESVLTKYHRSEFTILNDLDKLKEASIPRTTSRPTHQQSSTMMSSPMQAPVRPRIGSQVSDRMIPSPLAQPRSPLIQNIPSQPRVQELAELRRGSAHSMASAASAHSSVALPPPRRFSPSPPAYVTRSASPISLDARQPGYKSRSMDYRGQFVRQQSRSAEPPDPRSRKESQTRRARIGSRSGQYPADIGRSVSARNAPRIPDPQPPRTLSERDSRPPQLYSQSSVASTSSTVRNFLQAPQLNNNLSIASVASGLSDDRPVSARSTDTSFTYASESSMYVNGVSRPALPRELMEQRLAKFKEEHQRLATTAPSAR